MSELVVPDAGERTNLRAFLGRAIRLDEAAVVRLQARGQDAVTVWAPTGFDALAARVIQGSVSPADVTAAADVVLAGLTSYADSGIDLGFPMDSSWRGALPPQTGFAHIDDVPARALVELAQRGVEISKEHGRTPASLLDAEVITVTGAGDEVSIGMRTVFALTGMGFVREDADKIDESEVVRVRASKTWLRLDARFGSVATRRTQLSLLVS